MERIKMEHINDKLRTLNNRTLNDPEPSYGTPNMFLIDGAYGGYRITRICADGRGETDISPRGTKREINDFLYAILIGMNIANEQKEN